MCPPFFWNKIANIAVSKGNIMSKSINILDKEYIQWIKELSSRYRRSQIKAAVKVNEEMLRFYWELGRDIVERDAENRYGKRFYATLSRNLETELGASGFSVTNLKYSKYFYCLYYEALQRYMNDSENRPQLVDSSPDENRPQVVDKSDGEILTLTGTKLVNQIMHDLFSVPWGHHRFIIDKSNGDAQKALFYVRQTVENGWSRNVLLNFLDTDLYERQGKALTNFSRTLPDETSDLAQELTKDPYDFAFTGITGSYNERLLKDALLNTLACSSARRKTAYKPNMPWNRAASLWESRSTSWKSSIPKK